MISSALRVATDAGKEASLQRCSPTPGFVRQYDPGALSDEVSRERRARDGSASSSVGAGEQGSERCSEKGRWVLGLLSLG